MAIRKIHEVGDPCLTKVCRPVTEFNDRLHELLDDMADTLEEAGGVGLAAPQVGILRRVCIVEDEQGEIIELQGTGEGRPFTVAEQQTLVSLCAKGCRELMEKQKEIVGELL